MTEGRGGLKLPMTAVHILNTSGATSPLGGKKMVGALQINEGFLCEHLVQRITSYRLTKDELQCERHKAFDDCLSFDLDRPGLSLSLCEGLLQESGTSTSQPPASWCTR